MNSLVRAGRRMNDGFGMSESAPINRNGLLAIANASMFVFGVVLLLMGSLLPSLEFNYSRSGNLGAFPLVGIFVSTVLVGPILDLVGAKKVLAIALAVVAVSLGLMPALTKYPALAAAAFVYGMGGGGLNTATNALVADMSAAGRARALNLLGFFFSLGAISAPLMLSSIGHLSTSAVLRGLAALCLVILTFALSVRFPPALRSGRRLGSLLGVLKYGTVWLFAVLLFFESGSENSMFVWTAKIAADALHVSPSRADIALVALSGALGAGRIMAVPCLKWFGSRGLIWISTAVVMAGSLWMRGAGDMRGMIAAVIVVGAGLSAIFPTALGMAGDRFPEETGTVFGAAMAVALLGGTAGPKLAGWMASHGVRQVLLIPLLAAAGVALLTGVVAKRHPRAVANASVQP
jgi:MFS transporter, FHS family, glucose/mannose:H+ symporter